ncbi:MAG: Antitoxin Phd YefM, type toxin-antitoxin system [Candidatus Paceibacter sp.]|jgi:prevent-host-death family protein|nr:Antitoxin Phd YefM, type toxin-antitoxin system [Candidatus Paceibacter sp.]
MENGLPQEVPVSKFRTDIADNINKVGYGKEEFVITKNGRKLAALIPESEYMVLTALRKEHARLYQQLKKLNESQS